MKNLAKIFMAVAVALFALSCVNDTTEDIAVKVGGKTTLAISLDDTRTELGEAENGLYPVVWSVEDQISVNGITSDGLTFADGAGTANAVFTFNTEDLGSPLCVAYPAADEGYVVFADEQIHNNLGTTFDVGAATMYGYSNGGSVKLNHLTGVLKIGVVGTATLKSATISTIDRAPIAGAFAIDFTTGKVTPTENATNTIVYKFAGFDGLYLDEAEPTYLHIAVPAGTYDELYVTLTDADGGVMYKTVTAGDNEPLAAGKVRTFSSDIVYAATNAVVIKDAASLKAWAAGAKESTADAIMAADVDMSNETWTPVDGFKGRFLGNGFAIKGLSQPLFGTTNAKVIKGVHLVDANMTITNLPDAGTLACNIVETDAVVSHCSATGTLVINTNKPTVNANNKNNYYGALIGTTNSTKTFSNLYTNVALSTAAASVNSNSKHLYLTNLLGKGDSTSEATCVALENVTAHGTITHNSNSANQLYVGGLACTGVKSMTNCVNGDPNDETHTKGSITLGKNQTKNVFCCAMLNFIAPYAKLTNCHNYGNVVVDMTDIPDTFFLGGIAHALRGGLLDGCSNHGNLIFTSIKTNKSSTGLWVGCIAAGDTGSGAASTITGCQNYGDIVFEKGTTLRASSIGGLIGRRNASKVVNLTNCTNYGNIKLGDIEDDANRVISNNSAHLGGLIGMVSGTTEVKMENCVNNGNLLLNVNSDMPNSSAGCMRVGGIVGTLAGKLTDINSTVTNNGEIKCSFVVIKTAEVKDDEGKVIGTDYVKPGNISIGGVFGRVAENVIMNSNNLKVHNSANITVSMNPDHFATTGGVGGITGILTPEESSLSNASCNCTVTTTGLPTGILCGDLYSENTKATNCQVAGKVNITGTEVTIDNSNFFGYLYGRSPEYTAAQAASDNITIYNK